MEAIQNRSQPYSSMKDSSYQQNTNVPQNSPLHRTSVNENMFAEAMPQESQPMLDQETVLLMVADFLHQTKCEAALQSLEGACIVDGQRQLCALHFQFVASIGVRIGHVHCELSLSMSSSPPRGRAPPAVAL